MDASVAMVMAAVVAGIFGLLQATIGAIKYLWERRNGNGKHPYESARTNAKLDSMVGRQGETVGLLKAILSEQRETRQGIVKICSHQEAQSVYQTNLQRQLEKIEAIARKT